MVLQVPQPRTGSIDWWLPVDNQGRLRHRKAWKACRDAMREADRGRVVKPSSRTVAQYFFEWLSAVEPTMDATTWQNWKDYARTYVIPHIGAERLQRLNEPQLLQLFGKLLSEGRVKRDQNSANVRILVEPDRKGRKPNCS